METRRRAGRPRSPAPRARRAVNATAAIATSRRVPAGIDTAAGGDPGPVAARAGDVVSPPRENSAFHHVRDTYEGLSIGAEPTVRGDGAHRGQHRPGVAR